MPDDDIPVVCTIVSTAEYCNEIVGSLGRSVAKMLDPPYGDQVCCACHLPVCHHCLCLGLRSYTAIKLEEHSNVRESGMAYKACSRFTHIVQ